MFSSVCLRKPLPSYTLLSAFDFPRYQRPTSLTPYRQKLFFPTKRRGSSWLELSPLRAATSEAKTTEMDTTPADKLTALRKEMSNAKISALIVPTSDPHLMESPPARFKRRQFISNFSGSAGTAIVTEDKAALWTDGRYFLQAEKQLSSDWTLMKAGTASCPEIGDWLISVLKPGSQIGVDPFCHSESSIIKLSTKLSGHAISVVGTSKNLVDVVWNDQVQTQTMNPLVIHPMKFAGESVDSKLSRIRDEMKKKEATVLLVSTLDVIAWTLNLRGADDPNSPLFISYLLITNDSIVLFIEKEKVTTEVEDYLKSAGVEIKPYSTALDGVKTTLLENDSNRIWLDPDLISHAIFDTAKKALGPEKSARGIISQGTPLTLFMATKNEHELNGMREAHLRDAIAIIEFLPWLEEQVASGKLITEVDVHNELTLRRSKQPGFKGLSFPTIAGANENGAIIHYSAKEGSCGTVDKNTLLLIDSGGQYDCGTTDVTRTFHFSTPSDHQKMCFTRVLQGHIALATARFPTDTPGVALDALARRPLWSMGLDYRHGTGHGVGAHMCCHEGPISISFRVNSPLAQHPLKENMIVSNEPGYYEDGNFGIRIENLCIIKKEETKFNFGDTGFLGFETITFVPIQSRMINLDELSQSEINWINEYHQLVWDKLSDRVSPKAKEWLKDNTKPLVRL
eukprot:g5261.t1